MLPLFLALASALTISPQTIATAFGGHPGAFVLIDCASGGTFRSDPAACAEKLAPCSTFKIWNSAIGLELGIVTDPGAPFWKWDGVRRDIDTWNSDQTLRSAFAASCVPAYQNLAREIGPRRMQDWLDRIGYGDRNVSSGIDVFWLPKPGRQSIRISPDEQAAMIARLLANELPFSRRTLSTLKDIMKVRSTARGTLYGKTGTGGDGSGHSQIGWFVGYVESSGNTYAFACLVKGPGLMGKDARAATESLCTAQGLL